MAGEVEPLSKLAIRIFQAIANSCPSERSFSAVNFIQDEHRTRLSAEKTDQLIYIFMNTRTLRRQQGPPPTWDNLTPEEEQALEDQVFRALFCEDNKPEKRQED